MIRRGEVQLTRVVGTSAGAIVAAMLAADVDIETFRQVLLAGKGQELLSQLGTPGKLSFLKVFTTGLPIWNEKIVIDLLRPRFEEKKINFVRDVRGVQNTELFIVRTDLAAADSSVAGPDEALLYALAGSCGLPFAFRTWKTGPVVDGGITQNFAWQQLAETPGTVNGFGPVIGIMFDREVPNQSPGKSFEFCAALLGAAMDSATEKARLSLGKALVFSIKPSFGTFDFKAALDRGLTTEYDSIRKDAGNWFQDFVKDPEAVRGNIWAGESIVTMSKTARMYALQHSPRHIRYTRCSMVFYAKGLANENDYDIVEYQMEFHTLADAIFCHKLALSESDNTNTGFLKSSWSVTDLANQRLIDVWHVPIQDHNTPEAREVLAYFDPVLSSNSGPYLLKVRDFVRGLSKPLKEKRADDMLMVLERSSVPVGEISIVVHLPQNQSHNARWAPIPGACQGVQMTSFELSHYQSDPGYTAFGWKGSAVPPRYAFGAILQV